MQTLTFTEFRLPSEFAYEEKVYLTEMQAFFTCIKEWLLKEIDCYWRKLKNLGLSMVMAKVLHWLFLRLTEHLAFHKIITEILK
jgi:hypothetical protein